MDLSFYEGVGVRGASSGGWLLNIGNWDSVGDCEEEDIARTTKIVGFMLLQAIAP